jgi:hypothetical protein
MACAKAGGKQLTSKLFGLFDVLESKRFLFGAGHVEEIRYAANSEHKRVVWDLLRRNDFPIFFVDHRSNSDATLVRIECLEVTLNEAERVSLCLHCIRNVVLCGVDMAGSCLMQEGLPEMRRVAVDEQYLRPPLPADGVAESGCELKSARTTTYDDDSMWSVVAALFRVLFHSFPSTAIPENATRVDASLKKPSGLHSAALRAVRGCCKRVAPAGDATPADLGPDVTVRGQ